MECIDAKNDLILVQMCDAYVLLVTALITKSALLGYMTWINFPFKETCPGLMATLKNVGLQNKGMTSMF